jgi:DNA-directed RNA polymerase specialized sigma24 family protein
MGNQYLNNREFELVIEEYIRVKGHPDGEHPDYAKAEAALSSMFYVLAENIIRAFNFQLIDRDDALQEGVMICFDKIDRYNPNYVGKNGQKSKAFNYMTTCCLNHYRQLYRTAKNYEELKRRYREFLAKKSLEIFPNTNSAAMLEKINGTQNNFRR